jgi:hypothetical protein
MSVVVEKLIWQAISLSHVVAISSHASERMLIILFLVRWTISCRREYYTLDNEWSDKFRCIVTLPAREDAAVLPLIM